MGTLYGALKTQDIRGGLVVRAMLLRPPGTPRFPRRRRRSA